MALFSIFVATFITVGLAAGATIRITSPDSASAYHAGDTVAVQWSYDGDGEKFSIYLRKSGEQVADLCAEEADGVCFDLTQDQTVLLPDSGLESGSDYTIYVKDESSAEAESESFTVIDSSDVNIEVTSPNGATSLSAGGEVDVSWLYVGNNELFDIYLRRDGERVSENLCGSESDGSCRTSSPHSATVTLPSEIPDASDYTLLVVDKADDDAWGQSDQLPIGVTLSASDSSGLNLSTGSKIGLTVGLCALGVCLIALCLACCHKANKDRHRDEQVENRSVSDKRRPASSLAVEGIQQPDSPDQGKGSFLSRWMPAGLKSGRSGRKVSTETGTGQRFNPASPTNVRTDRPTSPEDNC